MLANLGFGVRSLPGLQIATFSLCPYMAQVGLGSSGKVFSYEIFLGGTVLEVLAYCVPTLLDGVINHSFLLLHNSISEFLFGIPTQRAKILATA